MIMPAVVLLPLAGIFVVQLLEPPPTDEHQPVFRDGRGAPLVARVEPGKSYLKGLS